MSISAKPIPREGTEGRSLRTARRIAILGLYGQLNLGNECTLQALVANLRQKEPGISLTAICSGPEDVRERHGIDAIPFYSSSIREEDAEGLGRALGKMMRPIRILFRRIPEEIVGLSRAMGIMRQKDMLLIGGTGILEDNIGWSVNWIWNLSKWVLAAKLSGAKVALVSIGAGPIRRPLDRWIINRLLSSADFVSYRDDYSIEYMESIGLATAAHSRFPDLAFGLPYEEWRKRDRASNSVAVGVMGYVGQRNSRLPKDGAYETYVRNMSKFMRSLLDEGYDVKILYGDVHHDVRVVADLKRDLREYSGSTRLMEAEIADVDDIVRELAGSRFVVASRFHNLILSLMLGKPTISISYHDKNDALLEMFGLGDYCHDIDAFDGDRLMEQFEDLVRKENEMESRILVTAGRLRVEVDRQYELLLNLSTK